MRKISALFLLCALCLALLPAIPKAEAVTVAGEKAIYVEKNEEAGLDRRIFPVRSADGSLTLYLPGAADPEKLRLSWAEGTKVTLNGSEQAAGQLPIPQPGQSVVLQVGQKYLRLVTVQGSAGVRAMYLDIDPTAEGFFPFSDMSADKSKERKSAGTVRCGSDSYAMTIKGRGNSTWTAYEKKGYNITLYKDDSYGKKQAAELLDGVSAKAWSLIANYTDGSLLRNKVGYDMACALGIGLESDFVDLYVDGVYQGCYLMTPKNDYQAPDEGLVLEIDNYLDDEDPQFTLEGLKEYHPTRYGFQNRFTVKENKTNASTQQIQAYVQAAWDALRDHDSEEYLRYIDLDSWAKYYLLHEFYKSFDVVCGSILMHRDGLTENDKLIAGPVWDLDNTMGRTNNNADLGMTVEQQHSPEGWYIQNVCDPEPWEGGVIVDRFWLQELGSHESFLKRVYALYLEHQAVFDGAAAQVRENADRIAATAQMNEDVIGFHPGAELKEPDSHGCVATKSWADCAANLETYARLRAAFLRNNIPGAQILPEPTEPTAPTEPAEPAKPAASMGAVPIAAVVVLLGGVAIFLALRKRKSA